MPHTSKSYNIRNQTADLLKGIAVIFMIQVHVMEQFAKPEIYESIYGKFSLFLGGPFCAPVFMAVMGYFLASSKKPFSYFLKRGIILFSGGIILNIARSANLLHYIFNGTSPANPYFFIFGVDILPLAGLSILIIGLLQLLFILTENRFAKLHLCFMYGITRSKQICLRKPDKNEYKRNYIYYFILAIIIAGISRYLPVFGADIKFSAFVNVEWSYFPLFPWFAYILLGFSLKLFNDKIPLCSKFTSGHCLVFSIPLLIFSVFTIKYAFAITHNLHGEDGYYHHDILFFGWMIIFISAYIMLVFLIEEYFGKQPIARFLKWTGKNVTTIYIIQWIIIGNIAAEIFQTQNLFEILLWFIGITIISCLLTFSFIKIKNNYTR